MQIAERALQEISDGQVVGLGTGRAATVFVETLGARAAAGLKIRGVPTSQASADLARKLGIPLATLDDVDAIDLTVDGADEVDPQLNLIKGYGGALVREKIVAAASRRLIILVGSEKIVPALGSRGKLPVEVVPFAAPLCKRRLIQLQLGPVIRKGADGQNYLTDNGNWILDCQTGAIEDPESLDRNILAIPGVVGTGLFVGMASEVLIQRGDDVEVRQR